MSIRTKLLYSFLLLTLLLVIHFISSFYLSQREHDLVKEMVVEQNISHQLSRLSIVAQKIRRYEKEYFIYVQSPSKRNQYYKEFSEAKVEINNVLSGLKRTYSKNEKNAELNQLVAWEISTLAYTDGFNKVHLDVVDGLITDVIQANTAIKKSKNKFRSVLSGSSNAIEDSFRRARLKADLIREFSKTSLLVSMVITIFSVVIGLVIAFQVPASITRPLQELSEVVTSISKGELNEKVDVKGSPEIVDISKSIGRLQKATLGLLKKSQHVQRDAVSSVKA